MVIQGSNHTYRIKLNKTVDIDIYKNSQKIFSFTDSNFKGEVFLRSYRNYQYYINSNLQEIILKTKELSSKYIQKINKIPQNKINKIITIDIETLNKNGVLIPYLYCMYDGEKYFNFFSKSPELLFNEILRRKYRNYTIYAHNLSRYCNIYI